MMTPLQSRLRLMLMAPAMASAAFVSSAADTPKKPAVIASVAVHAPATNPMGNWDVRLSDVTLAQTFRRWAKTSGYRIVWDANKNVAIGAPDVYEMSFEDAVAATLATPGIQASEYPLEVCFYPNQPPLARITRRGAQDKECF